MTLIPIASIPATAGEMGAFVALPRAAPKATVLIQVELWGMTAHMGEVARRLAAEGHAAIVCDLVRGAPAPAPSDALEKWGETFVNFDDVRCTRDCRHALHWALSDPGGLGFGRVFSWGLCMGGRSAHNLAAFETRLAGAINFYGRLNFPRLPNKPFLPIEVTRMIETPYLGVFAETDDMIPPGDVERLREDLSGKPGTDILVYDGTEHAFCNDHRDAYHPDAAADAWQKVLDFLEANLHARATP